MKCPESHILDFGTACLLNVLDLALNTKMSLLLHFDSTQVYFQTVFDQITKNFGLTFICQTNFQSMEALRNYHGQIEPTENLLS